MIPIDWIETAADRINEYIVHTPISHDEDLNLYIKWENKQITGSFKVRGAINRVLSLEPWEKKQCLVTASAGNHGQGVALAGRIVGTKVVVFVSDHAVQSKVDSMKELGAEIKFVKGGYGLSESSAIDYSIKNQATYISPYNDPQVIAGQGTIGLEILKDFQMNEPASWVVPVGGGGLISGLGIVKKANNCQGDLIGIQSESSAFTHALFHGGKQEEIEDKPTLADGLSGPMQDGSITLPIIKNFVDNIFTVSEREIKHAISFAWKKYHEKIEGSAAVSLAAILSGMVKPPALIIITGGNIQKETHHQIIDEY
ncbi:threonine/serine dehydratase [Chloroflexota bacterium]